ncbi:histone acetyltransferase KAT6B [Eurosta solidaginis]|uniref:histone acetyltransferase KAT6B n=1 Tax=Eurosta solidaginis TaxID=178769 RepID=UPI0035308AD7
MKKVARLRVAQNEEASGVGGADHVGVRTTGRIKKPKAVFDPSDNYLPRSQRPTLTTSQSSSTGGAPVGTSLLVDRKRDTPTSQHQVTQESKRISQTSTTLGTPPTATTTAAAAQTPETTANTDVCDVCQKREAKRGTHAKNKLIKCLDCERRVHKLCLPVDFEDIDTLRQNYRCDNCRTCDVCDAFADEPKINQPMVTCTKCIKSYHLTCHIPNVFKFQQIFRWKCNKCVPVLNNGGKALPVKTIREIIGDEPKRTPTPQKLPEQQQPQELQENVNIAAAAEEAKGAAAAAKRALQESKGNDRAVEKITNGAGAETNMESVRGSSASSTSSTSNSDSSSSSSSSTNTKRSAEVRSRDDATTTKKQKTSIDEIAVNNTHTPVIRYSPYEPIDVPDVKDWNVDQVATYFAKYFPNEAHVFKEHEIDGTSLLLLKRSDVIKKLPIKLGPSLRIYSLILKIQTQLNDPTLGWNCGL